MKVFMLGWEFPPHISGGLGTACHGLTKGLDEVGVDVVFVVPTAVPVDSSSHVKLQSPATLPLLNRPGAPAAKPRADVIAPPQPINPPTQVSKRVEVHQVAARLEPYRQGQPASQPAVRSVPDPDAPFDPAQATQQPLGIPGLPNAAEPQPDESGSDAPASGEHYGTDLMTEVQKYARLALELAAHE